MDLLQCGGKIRVAGVEVARSPFCPPLPVLNNGVERDVAGAILFHNSNQFILRLVAVLGLKEPVSPLAEERSASGQVAILVNDGVRIRPIDEIVVQPFRRIRGESDGARKLVVETALRGSV